MKMLPEIKPIRSDLSDRTLTLNLILKAPGAVCVRSCEVLGRGFRNRLSFHEGGQLEDVLVDQLAVSIRTCLQSVPNGAHILALPEFLVELPGLALQGVHVMIMEAKDGIRNAILRFTEFLGSANNAFLPDVGFDVPVVTHGEKLAMNVLEDICMPILNLCHAFDDIARTQGHALPVQMADRARELQFQTELLKRFMCNASGQQNNALNRGLEAQLAALQLRLEQY